MATLDQLVWWLGYAFVIIGGAELAFLLLAGIGLAACKAWIRMGTAFGHICKTESLMHKYRRKRNGNLHWLKLAEKDLINKTRQTDRGGKN